MYRVFSPLQQALITWLLVLLAGWATLNLLSYIGELLSILITAGLIAFILNYPVKRLQEVVPRNIAAVIVYVATGFFVVIIGITLLPIIIEQARQFVNNAPSLLESARSQLTELQQLSESYNLPIDVPLLEQQVLAQLQKPLQSIASGSVGLVLGTFNGVLDLILILVISFYMLVDGERVWQGLIQVFATSIRTTLTLSLQQNLQKFVSGQLLLGLFMAVTLSFVFFWLRVPFFLLFAVFIGVMEVIPFIGATLGIGTVGIIVAFLDWWLALQVVGAAIAVQQVKDNLVAPRILGNLTGSSPVVIFAALLLGGRLGGLLGVILAIPLIGVIKSIVDIVLDPTLPPQTGSFFYNPLADQETSIVLPDGSTAVVAKGVEGSTAPPPEKALQDEQARRKKTEADDQEQSDLSAVDIQTRLERAAAEAQSTPSSTDLQTRLERAAELGSEEKSS